MVRMDVWVEPDNATTNEQHLIKLRTWNTNTDDSSSPLSVSKPIQPIGFYAQVTQNRRPIQGAQVSAYVYDSTGVLLSQVPLLDEGVAGLNPFEIIYKKILNDMIVFNRCNGGRWHLLGMADGHIQHIASLFSPLRGQGR